MFWKQLAALTVLTAISSMALTNPVLKRTADLGQDLEPPKGGKDPKEIIMRQANISAEIDRRGMTIPALENENEDMQQADEKAVPRALLSARNGDENLGETMGKGCRDLCKCAGNSCPACKSGCNLASCLVQIGTKCWGKATKCNKGKWHKKVEQFFFADGCLLLEQEEENSTKESDQETEADLLKDGHKDNGLDESLQGKRSC